MGRGQNKSDEFEIFIEGIKSHLCNTYPSV